MQQQQHEHRAQQRRRTGGDGRQRGAAGRTAQLHAGNHDRERRAGHEQDQRVAQDHRELQRHAQRKRLVARIPGDAVEHELRDADNGPDHGNARKIGQRRSQGLDEIRHERQRRRDRVDHGRADAAGFIDLCGDRLVERPWPQVG